MPLNAKCPSPHAATSRARWLIDTGRARVRAERGALLTEYGMLLFLIAIAAVGVLLVVGGEVLELFLGPEQEFNRLRDQGTPPPD